MAKLTIFITNSKSGAFFEIAKGWKNAFAAGGHKVIMWDGSHQTWNAAEPDIFIGCSGWRQTPPKTHQTRIAIHTNPYCDTTIQIPSGPLINEQKVAIDWTVAQKPKFVFGYGLQDDMYQWWYGWKKNHDIDVVGMPNAADATIYKPGKPRQSLVCDVGWVGGYWGYKAINMDKYIVPVARKYKSIWLGWSGPKDLWKGKTTQEEICALFHSAKICPCVVEPHTTKFGIDIPERIFKVAASGAMTISDPVVGIDRYFNKDVLPTATNPDHYMELCHMYINMNDAQRKTQAKLMRKEVMENHTYYNRVRQFLKSFGYYNEADEYDAIIARIAA
jgi:hypothetical protein